MAHQGAGTKSRITKYQKTQDGNARRRRAPGEAGCQQLQERAMEGAGESRSRAEYRSPEGEWNGPNEWLETGWRTGADGAELVNRRGRGALCRRQNGPGGRAGKSQASGGARSGPRQTVLRRSGEPARTAHRNPTPKGGGSRQWARKSRNGGGARKAGRRLITGKRQANDVWKCKHRARGMRHHDEWRVGSEKSQAGESSESKNQPTKRGAALRKCRKRDANEGAVPRARAQKAC